MKKSSDVRGNIGELVDMAQTLGFQAIVVLIELNEWETEQAASDLDTLFSQDLLENKGFWIKAALPESLLTSQAGVMEKAGGHFHLTPLSYVESEIDEMAVRHLQTATGGVVSSVQELAETAVLQRGQEEIIKIYGRLVPGGWLNWIETLLAEYVQQNRKAPFTKAEVLSLLISFYKQHIRLRADETGKGIWRGPQFLKMDKQPLEILCRLIELDGEASPDELKRLAGNSKTYLNTIAGRIRDVVEPLADEKIYIQNRRDIGYWLENGRSR
ncbi:MAG: hypothetical protein M5U34_27915 [Chloroflexi bacterium]|nr:hypothetical protein [Chloroflexota bacterium]